MREGISINITVGNDKDQALDLRLYKEYDDLSLAIIGLEEVHTSEPIENLILNEEEINNLIDALKFMLQTYDRKDKKTDDSR